MDFKEEEDLYFSRIIELKNSILTAEPNEKESLNRQLGVATGTSLWLITNSSSIQSLEDFRSKIDSFTRVISHPLYIEMEGNLCVSSTINGYLSGRKSEEAYSEVMSLLEYDGNLSRDELAVISRERYDKAKNCYGELKSDAEVLKDANECGFAINFKFTDDHNDAEALYTSVSSFCGVSEELEEVYRKKRTLQSAVTSGEVNSSVIK